MLGRPNIFAHRGNGGDEPENSLGAFNRVAKDSAIDGVEFDVKVTKDRVFIVFHDRDTLRLTGKKGDIGQMSWEEVQELSLFNPKTGLPTEEKIPTLKNILQVLAGSGGGGINIESKDQELAKPILEVVDECVEEYGLQKNNVIFGRRSTRALSSTHQKR